jgi:predicted metal-dependent enzyme (double-stranded beta helix superfamily)
VPLWLAVAAPIEADARAAGAALDDVAESLLFAYRRYSVLAMVWNVGQGTPLHDHSGTWCVECVYQGRIRVTSYSVRGGDPESGVVQFARETEILAGPAEAGALIPPFEYHVLANAGDQPAVTIHVYGGEMTSCHIYEPVEGGWRRRYRALEYTP